MVQRTLQKKLFLYFSAFLVIYIYLSCIPAAVYHGDNGETITAGYILGIQHPPGYPLFTLMSKTFTLLPAGDISYRVYLLSAALSLISFFALFLFTSRLYKTFFPQKDSFFPALSSALIFSFGFFIWQQSITAKGGIYILNILFTIILSHICLLTFDKKQNTRTLIFLFAFVYGLSFTNHYMSQLIILPAYLFLFYKNSFTGKLNIQTLVFSFIFFCIGFSAYLVLFIRAETALINWGRPDTLERFIQVFTRYQYLTAEGSRSVISSLRQSGKFFSSLLENFLYIGALFAGAGCFRMFKTNRAFFYFLAGIPLIFLLVVSIYLNLTPKRLYIMETYLTPVYFPVSVLAAIGIDALFRKKFLKISALSAIVLLSIVFYFPHHNHSRHFFAYDYNKNILDSLEPGSLVFITGDAVVFPLWYLKYVKNHRPDVTLAGSAVLPMKWVRDSLKKQNPDIRLPAFRTEKMGKESIGPIIDGIIKMNIRSMPVYFSYNKPEKGAVDKAYFTLMPKGNVYRVIPKEHADASEEYIHALKNIWKYYSLRNIAGTYSGIPDKKTRELYIKDLSIAANTAGTFLENAEKFKDSLYFFHLAHKISHRDPVYPFNMGNAFYNLNDTASALKMYKKSLEADPAYDKALYNTAVIYYKKHRYSKSLEYFLKLKEYHPERTDIATHIDFQKKAAGNR